MRAAAHLMLGLALAVPGLFVSESVTAQANVAHTHIGHVADRFNDTPANRGLLATAAAEAGVAAQHAGLAGQQPENLEYMKTHTVHVIHAIDPTVEDTGPGAGYGVKKAAQSALTHIEMAGGVQGASTAVEVLAGQIATSAKNVIRWSDELLAIAKQIQATEDAATAAALIPQMAALADKIANGHDVNGDGQVGWQEGEGGLRQAEQRSTLLKRAEGLAAPGGEP